MRTVDLSEPPTGITLDDNYLYVTTFDKIGKLHIVALNSGAVEKTIVTGSGACAPLLDSVRARLYVCNQFQNTISEIDLNSRQVVRTVNVLREPKSMLLSKDGKYLFSTNYLPAQQANLDEVAACVSVIRINDFTKVKDIKLAMVVMPCVGCVFRLMDSICMFPTIWGVLLFPPRNYSKDG